MGRGGLTYVQKPPIYIGRFKGQTVTLTVDLRTLRSAFHQAELERVYAEKPDRASAGNRGGGEERSSALFGTHRKSEQNHFANE